MKTAVSIPDNIYESAEKLANRLGQSRSQLYTKAITSYVEKQQNTNVTDKLNEVYGSGNSSIDPVLQNLQTQSLLKNNPW
jgi:metal-responsive CopG/Arc/MetJ family transcriptional regulator